MVHHVRKKEEEEEEDDECLNLPDVFNTSTPKKKIRLATLFVENFQSFSSNCKLCFKAF